MLYNKYDAMKILFAATVNAITTKDRATNSFKFSG